MKGVATVARLTFQGLGASHADSETAAALLTFSGSQGQFTTKLKKRNIIWTQGIL